MKKVINLLRCATVSLAALFFCSCASTPGHQASFHQQDACDAIVRFSSWDLITINKPDTRQAGFLPLYKQSEAQQVLARSDVGRGRFTSIRPTPLTLLEKIRELSCARAVLTAATGRWAHE